MIQRKQSLWLLLAGILLVLTLQLPYGMQTAETPTSSSADLNAHHNNLLLVVVIAGAAISWLTVFLYNQRGLQKRLCLLCLVIALLSLGIMGWDVLSGREGHHLVFGFFGSRLYIGILLPALGSYALYMAYRGIRNDERLLKDADRIR